MPYLALRAAWTSFAPSHETLAIEYDPPGEGELVWVQLEVRDAADALVYRSDELDCAEGPADVSWTGALNQGNDANTEPFATPLRSPYALRLRAEIRPAEPVLVQPEDIPNSRVGEDSHCPLEEQRIEPVEEVHHEDVLVEEAPPQIEVAVLYHSISIVRGPWDATDTDHGRLTPAGLCHRLNQLGYYAGPPAHAGVDAALLNKAKERFRRNHGDLRANANPSAAEFADALDHEIGAHTARPTLTDHANAEVAEGAALPTDAGEPLRVYLEAVGFDEDLAHQTDEFMQQIPANRVNPDWGACENKTRSEARKLNRPMIPLEAVITLKDHAGASVAAPRAVGAVRVDWSAIEPGEDTSTLSFNDRLHDGTRTYIERLFTSHRVDLHRDGSTNCPEAYGGIRTQANNYRNPFWREAQPYAPYAQPTDDGARALWVPAYTDWASHQARVGRSGIYFRPSLIAGDRYRIRATLSFAGQGNQAALEQANPNRICLTRTVAVWRRVEVFAVVGWPTRNYGNLPAKCRSRYSEAYHEVDFTHTNFTDITHAITDQDYDDWFQHVQGTFPAVAHTVGVIDHDHRHAQSPLIFLALNPVLNDNQQMGVYTFANNMFNELVNQPNVRSAGGFLLGRIAERLRVGHPAGGALFLEYRFTDQARGILTRIVGDVPTVSNGNADLMGIIDQAVDANPDYVFTHELAHCFWLTHHEASSGVIPQHHDQYDHNCVMSYPYWGNGQPPYPHHAPNQYDPTFCGKCNLKLRGWDITHDHILELDAPTPPDNLKLLLYYDAADPGGLGFAPEVRDVRAAFTQTSRGPFRERSFHQNADFNTWRAELGDCDIYHHIAHGNVRCSKHNRRLATMELVTPRYPVWCRSDMDKVAELQGEEYEIFANRGSDPDLLLALAEKCIKPSTWFHSLRSVIQWVGVGDSSTDIEFTYEQIEHAFKHGTAAPTRLAYFSSCLMGWDKRFAKLFIDHGTANVIAFRSHYQAGDAVPFCQDFYSVWKLHGFAANQVLNAFQAAALGHPHAEPCLFTAGGIYRAFGLKKNGPQGDILGPISWNDDAFMQPRFPAVD